MTASMRSRTPPLRRSVQAGAGQISPRERGGASSIRAHLCAVLIVLGCLVSLEVFMIQMIHHDNVVEVDAQASDAGASATVASQDTYKGRHFQSTTSRTALSIFSNFNPNGLTDNLDMDAPVTVMVMSARANVAARNAIRNSWARDFKHKVLFVVGKRHCEIPYKLQDPTKLCGWGANVTLTESGMRDVLRNNANAERSINKDLERENRELNDLVIVDVIDSYGNLPNKTLNAIVWAAEHRPNDWIVKIDDDGIAFFPNIIQHAATYDPLVNATLIGDILSEHNPVREGKWAEFEFDEPIYPPYPQGAAGYMMSATLVKYFAERQLTLPRYHNEDATVGIWVRELQREGLAVDIVATTRFHFINKASSCPFRYVPCDLFTVGHAIRPHLITRCSNVLYRWVARQKCLKPGETIPPRPQSKVVRKTASVPIAAAKKED